MNIRFKVIVLCFCLVIIGKHGFAENTACRPGCLVTLAVYHIVPNIPLNMAEFEEFKSTLSVDEDTLLLKTGSRKNIKINGIVAEYVFGCEQITRLVVDDYTYELRVLVSKDDYGNKVEVRYRLFNNAVPSSIPQHGFLSVLPVHDPEKKHLSFFSHSKDGFIQDAFAVVFFWADQGQPSK